jgi:uncharacterized protein YdeI (YjbR/CyaY-like superfamily)
MLLPWPESLTRALRSVRVLPRSADVALCYGWIDGQKKSAGKKAWLQKFTPRAKKNIWSKVNRQKALALIKDSRMKSAGLKEIERAKKADTRTKRIQQFIEMLKKNEKLYP